jgi:hypothetical protein
MKEKKSKRNRNNGEEFLPSRLPLKEGKRLVHVYVEGYDDVAFWRGIFDDFESDKVTFEIAVPPRPDLAKGKRVVMNMIEESSPLKLLCVDSDFDYLFAGCTAQSRLVIDSPYLFHTYTYATENYLCYAPTLHTICTKTTKNDTRIFDFEAFLEAYSRIIYPVFLWYAYSARLGDEHLFTLLEFKNTVKLNYLEVENGGADTLQWVAGNVNRKLHTLETHYADWKGAVHDFAVLGQKCDLHPENTYLFMHGHTLLDNVVIPMLNAVCDKLKLLASNHITTSAQKGTALNNEISNYRNALLNVRDTLTYNEDYKSCFLYSRLHGDIRRMLEKSNLL